MPEKVQSDKKKKKKLWNVLNFQNYVILQIPYLLYKFHNI